MLADDQDRRWMERALGLSRASVGLASPNPQVGCVLVRDGVLIGEGAHHFAKFDHAEIVALKAAADAGAATVRATAYVTLEPCSHHGRTGPCARALIAAGIESCVVATVDPNPMVSGRGIGLLRDAGIEVKTGVMEAEARGLNEAFATSITLGRPFVTLKSGLSVDGRLAPTPELRTERAPHFLTGAESREEVQGLRHASDAVLTGIGTVLADDPLLTDRTGRERRRRLMRVVLDAGLRMPVDAKLLQPVEDDVWIFCGEDASALKEAELVGKGARVTRIGRDEEVGLSLVGVLGALHEARMISVLLEAGSRLNAACLRADLVDRVSLFYAPIELGAGAVPFADGYESSFALEQRLTGLTKLGVGDDVRVSGLLHDPWAGISSLRSSRFGIV